MKKVFGKRTYVSYKDCTPGQVLFERGVYVKSEVGNFDKLNHIFRVEDGELVLNSANKLNWLIENFLVPGTVCKVIYLGKILLTKGPMKGKEAHDFDLYTEGSTEAVVAPEEDVVRADTANLPEMSI